MRELGCRFERNGVPLLVTVDLELARDHDLEQQRRVLDRLRGDLAEIGLPVTVFTTAEAAERCASEVSRLTDAGHEVACHGLTHAAGEDYSRMPVDSIRNALAEATRRIAAVVGESPCCFRGPRMTTSTAAQRVLVELGYRADFSVCSQRVDIPNSAGGRLGWLAAPRRPYLPSATSPFRRGAVPIRVVPLSCTAAPFLSGILYLFGARFMRGIFDLLLHEARRTSKPIVYAFHTYEFCDPAPAGDANEGHTKPKRLHRLYRQDRDWRYASNLALLRHMLAQLDIVPTTGSAYLDRLDGVAEMSRDRRGLGDSEPALGVSPWCTRP